MYPCYSHSTHAHVGAECDRRTMPPNRTAGTGSVRGRSTLRRDGHTLRVRPHAPGHTLRVREHPSNRKRRNFTGVYEKPVKLWPRTPVDGPRAYPQKPVSDRPTKWDARRTTNRDRNFLVRLACACVLSGRMEPASGKRIRGRLSVIGLGRLAREEGTAPYTELGGAHRTPAHRPPWTSPAGPSHATPKTKDTTASPNAAMDPASGNEELVAAHIPEQSTPTPSRCWAPKHQ